MNESEIDDYDSLWFAISERVTLQPYLSSLRYLKGFFDGDELQLLCLCYADDSRGVNLIFYMIV